MKRELARKRVARLAAASKIEEEDLKTSPQVVLHVNDSISLCIASTLFIYLCLSIKVSVFPVYRIYLNRTLKIISIYLFTMYLYRSSRNGRQVANNLL